MPSENCGGSTVGIASFRHPSFAWHWVRAIQMDVCRVIGAMVACLMLVKCKNLHTFGCHFGCAQYQICALDCLTCLGERRLKLPGPAGQRNGRSVSFLCSHSAGKGAGFDAQLGLCRTRTAICEPLRVRRCRHPVLNNSGILALRARTSSIAARGGLIRTDRRSVSCAWPVLLRTPPLSCSTPTPPPAL